MSSDNHQNNQPAKSALLIAAMVGQVGLITLIIVLAAVLGGRALDASLGTGPWFTIGLVLVSIPVSLLLMIFVARKTVGRIKTEKTSLTGKEDEIGKNS